MKKVNLLVVMFVFAPLFLFSQTVIDIEGNVYQTVIIGKQLWMAENLKTLTLNNGTPITNITDNTEWGNAVNPAYCFFDNNASYKDTYGALYNWHAVNTQMLCPTGWHVPTNPEMDSLAIYLGGSPVAGSKMKEVGNAHWTSMNTDATNESGFTALPGGGRIISTGLFNYALGQYAFFWTATNISSAAAGRYISYYSGALQLSSSGQQAGMSVRCVNDTAQTTDLKTTYSVSICVYPNPVIEKLNIIISDNSKVFQVKLYDVSGRIVLSKNIANIDQIDLTSFNPGYYLLSIIDDENRSICKKKIIKK